jgi:hypothetical protein
VLPAFASGRSPEARSASAEGKTQVRESTSDRP